MYRKIVWCYVFVLTLLDISLNTKLSAQGKSHGVTVHDSLIEGITFQEWGAESVSGGGAAGGQAAGGGGSGALSLSPPALQFGRAALAAAHALTVTLTNTANTTVHLASVAGTTPDFHASFFDSKSVPPQGNTTFSVVYLGRREGSVSAHLYIHTSLGVHKYPVSAVGVASEWGVWPLVGVRVPHNASVEPLLTLHNPTEHAVQVSEVYSSGAWLGLALPDGGESAPRGVWTIPPRTTRPLVRLRLNPPPAPPAPPLTAYIRIKANITGGGLVVCVEARSVPAGEYLSPLQLRMTTRGSLDPPDIVEILAGNSGGTRVPLEGGVWAHSCAAEHPHPPPPPTPPTHHPTANGQADKGTANGNGVKSEGVYVSLVRQHLEPHQQLTRAATLKLDYGSMWSSVGGGEGGEGGAWCAGWVLLGGAALPYSLRLLPGTLTLTPHELHFVTSNREECMVVREVRVHNEFPAPVHIAHVHLPPDVQHYFEVESLTPLVLSGGRSANIARVRLRTYSAELRVDSHLVVRTNLTDYKMPLYVYSGRLHIEWEWPDSSEGHLRLGVVGTSSTRRVSLTLHNPAPVSLCVVSLGADVGGAGLALAACGARGEVPPEHVCRCVAAGGAARATLTVVAPARAGAVRGAAWLWAAPPRRAAPPALTRAPIHLTAHAGHLAVPPIHLYRSAPYVWSTAPLVLENSMNLQMKVLEVLTPADQPALMYSLPAEASAQEIVSGRRSVGTVIYAAERQCAPHCYTGLSVDTGEGGAWLARAATPGGAALRADGALAAARHRQFLGVAARGAHNVTLRVRTSGVALVWARAAAWAAWPRLAEPARAAPTTALHAPHHLTLRVRNPSRTHPLLLQPVISTPLPDDPLSGVEGAGVEVTCGAACSWDTNVWSLRTDTERAHTYRSDVTPPAHNPLLVLPPHTDLHLKITFTPTTVHHTHAYLYLRNNLTILEKVHLSGRGAYPSFELGGRRPGTNAPLMFEVTSCGWENGGEATIRRQVLVRNTGAVPVRLREWRVSGVACAARGFSVAPCAPLALQPNTSQSLTLAFTPDYTLARVHATLSARTDTTRAAFLLRAAAPADLLPRCAALRPPPPAERATRAAAALAALAALALVLAAAALDAERALRRARAARPPPPARAPLDLRALATPPPPAAPRARPQRRRRTPRQDPRPDPHAERRAFERWRAEVLSRAAAADTDARPHRHSDEPDHPPDRHLHDDQEHQERATPPPDTDGYDADPETEDRPPDDDALSTGSGSGSGTGSASASSSTPTVDERDDVDDVDEQDTVPLLDASAHAAREHSPGGRAAAAECLAGGSVSAAPARGRTQPSPARRTPRSRTAEGADTRDTTRTRAPAPRIPTRKDKPSKRVRARPSNLSPCRTEPSSALGAASPGGAGSAGGPGGALRWGASWSSVVAGAGGAGAGAAGGPGPLAPIGSDVRRRSPPHADHSLFYFNGDAHAHHDHTDFTWRHVSPPPPPPPPAFTPATDYLGEESAGGAYRSVNSVWGSALEPAAWLWGASSVRPPPGFGAPARPAPRPYDPFRSLASIWAPGAMDWRCEPAPEPEEPSAPQ